MITDLLDTPSVWTERRVLDLLRTRYTRVRPGTNADRYVRAEHARWVDESAWHSATAARIADMLVWDTYGGGTLIGHEVKVSRSDWLSERRDPTKAEVWRRHCNRWYLVISDSSIVRDDLPDGWGLIAPDRTGKLRVARQSPLTVAEPMSPICQASLARAVAQTATREAQAVGQ